jgi:hypothetical protein
MEETHPATRTEPAGMMKARVLGTVGGIEGIGGSRMGEGGSGRGGIGVEGQLFKGKKEGDQTTQRSQQPTSGGGTPSYFISLAWPHLTRPDQPLCISRARLDLFENRDTYHNGTSICIWTINNCSDVAMASLILCRTLSATGSSMDEPWEMIDGPECRSQIVLAVYADHLHYTE